MKCGRLLMLILALGLEALASEATPLPDARLTEVSGVARSLRAPTSRRWCHNDSGDAPRLFALRPSGQVAAVLTLTGVTAVDWEDMTSGLLEGRPTLIVADVGDNPFAPKRPSVEIHLVDEPDFAEGGAELALAETPRRSIRFTYEDGAHDCEAVALDPESGRLLLVEKGFAPQARIYALDLTTGGEAMARRVGSVPVVLATGLDFCPAGEQAALSTVGGVVLFTRPDRSHPWVEWLSRAPRPVMTPALRQPEAICFTPEGSGLLLIGEGRPAHWITLSIPIVSSRPTRD